MSNEISSSVPSEFHRSTFRPDPDALAGRSRADLLAEDFCAPDLGTAVDMTVLFEGTPVRRVPMPTRVYPPKAGAGITGGEQPHNLK